jgi:hypothetical protein
MFELPHFLLLQVQNSLLYPLARWRERVGVRVDMICPLTCILSPRGEESIEDFLWPTGGA